VTLSGQRVVVVGGTSGTGLAAFEALARALALELGPLRVNTIRPGYTDSEMWSGLSREERDDLRRRVAVAVG
jgi:NAD(P)-dependent dehydrogenase (short-subunit alcohol dehydrogenase family)